MIDIGILIGIGGFALAVLTFFVGRQSSIKAEGKSDGAALATIQSDIKYVREKVTELSEASEKREARHDESIRRVYEKIEANTQRIAQEMKEHVQKYHS